MTNRTPAAMPLAEQKTAIIVGASSGMGADLARVMVADGYRVALLARRLDRLEALAAELNANGQTRALIYQHDVLDFDAVPGLLQQIAADLGGLDVFVYMAGIMFPNDKMAFDAGKDRQTFMVNTVAAANWLVPVAERFARAKRGHIVGISSVAGARGRAGTTAYAASKAALDTYLSGLRTRMLPYGVTVTDIMPGQVQTEMLANADKTRGPIPSMTAAKLIYRAIRQRKDSAYVPARWGLIALVFQHIPRFIYKRLGF